jgi:hypothetical protein
VDICQLVLTCQLLSSLYSPLWRFCSQSAMPIAPSSWRHSNSGHRRDRPCAKTPDNGISPNHLSHSSGEEAYYLGVTASQRCRAAYEIGRGTMLMRYRDSEPEKSLAKRLRRLEQLVEEAEPLVCCTGHYCVGRAYLLLDKAVAVATGIIQDFYLDTVAVRIAARNLSEAEAKRSKAEVLLAKAQAARQFGHCSKVGGPLRTVRTILRNQLGLLWVSYNQIFQPCQADEDRFANPWSEWQDTGGEG